MALHSRPPCHAGLESVCAAPRRFLVRPRFGRLVLTAFNPDHTDPGGFNTCRPAEAFAVAFAGWRVG